MLNESYDWTYSSNTYSNDFLKIVPTFYKSGSFLNENLPSKQKLLHPLQT